MQDDPETHDDGQLVPVYGSLDVYVEDKLVIVAVGDKGRTDGAGHSSPDTDPQGCSGDVSAYD